MSDVRVKNALNQEINQLYASASRSSYNDQVLKIQGMLDLAEKQNTLLT